MSVEFDANFGVNPKLSSTFKQTSTLSSTLNSDEKLGASFKNNSHLRAGFSSDKEMNSTFGSTVIIHEGPGGDCIYSDTTAHWNANPKLISEKNKAYVYLDHESIEEDGKTKWIPGVKIGDGKAYLIDLPFTDEVMIAHIRNLGIHVTPEEKEFWNNKVRTYMDTVEGEQLVFTTH